MEYIYININGLYLSLDFQTYLFLIIYNKICFMEHYIYLFIY